MVGVGLFIFSVFCVVLLCVFTLLVSCCYVCYDFRIKTMFGSSFPSVVCRTAHCFIYVMFGSSCLFMRFFASFLIFTMTLSLIPKKQLVTTNGAPRIDPRCIDSDCTGFDKDVLT